ncbi:MAG: OB-fold nucleic acid binding domain-containing protein, partial [Bacteroidales bacterium]
MEFTELNEQELIRRDSLKAMRDLGVDPYPAESYEINTTAKEIKDKFQAQSNDFQDISIAGRIMTRRVMGAASFLELQDETGRIQVYVKRDSICPGDDKSLYNTVFKKLLDIGDIIGIKGHAFITQAGELSVYASQLKVLSKSLRVLPIVKEKEGQKYDAFTDP